MISRRTLLVAPLLALAGCQPSSPEAPAPSTGPAGAQAGGALKVGLLTNGSLTDSGWNSLAGEGLKQMESELGATTSHQSAGAAQAEEALRGFARDGCSLVFAHGNEFGDAAKLVGEEYPDTTFVVSSGEVEGPNVASLRFDLGEASYLAGMAAAGLSKTGKAGQIGGQSFPPVKQAFELFEKGGKAVNPEFSAATTYVGDWSDAGKAKEQALSMIRGGADIIFQNADAAGEGVFQAAEESKGVLVIGSNANQNDLKPEVIAASAVIDVPKTFMTVARDVGAGSFKGQVYREDLKSGNVYLAVNPAFKERIPAEVMKKIEQAEEDIKSGKLVLVEK
jgi:basic membrane lipoprotein Med (substrate-binding protein (PBP1-ABC) superfamily)